VSSQIVRAEVETFLREIEFTAALSQLQGFLERRVMVTVTAHERFGVSFVSRLERVESLPTEGSPVMLHFESGEALDLDPDLRAFLGAGHPGQLRWLEFWAGARTPAVTIEVILLSDPGD
jgi:hypothetical protein